MKAAITRLARPPQGFLSLFLLFLLLLSVVWCIQAAQWVDGLTILTFLVLYSVLIGYVTARLDEPSVVLHIIGFGFGVYLCVWFVARQDFHGNLITLWSHIVVWANVARGGGVSEDTSIFLLLMTLLVFILGYGSTWLTYRSHHPWVVTLSCALVLLINLNWAPNNLVGYVGFFLLACLLYLARVNSMEHLRQWKADHVQHKETLPGSLTQAGVVVSVIALLLGVLLPHAPQNAALASMVGNVTARLSAPGDTLTKLFAAVNAPDSQNSNFQSTLALHGALHLGDQTELIVTSSAAHYLQAATYATYNGGQWTTPNAVTTMPISAGQSLQVGHATVQVVHEHVQVVTAQTDVLFGANQIISSTLSALVRGQDIPASTLSIDPANGGFVVGWKLAHSLAAGQTYEATSAVPTASEAQLRADDNGSDAVTRDPGFHAEYTQLPNLPARVINLAQTVVAGYGNNYDRAVAIEQYLRTNMNYNLNIATPPSDDDPVDNFLFNTKNGYCDYFASAMTVMARAVGLPARLVSGYTAGTKRNGVWVVT